MVREREEFDDEDDDDYEVGPDQRTYEHLKCGGQTVVSGGDYEHISNPMRMCTGTYCCTCQGMVGLNQVVWADTGEKVSDDRARLRRTLPGVLKAWAYGLGFAIGGVLGAVVGAAIGAANPGKSMAGFVAGGAVVGAMLVGFVGGMILKSAYGLDFRRMK